MCSRFVIDVLASIPIDMSMRIKDGTFVCSIHDDCPPVGDESQAAGQVCCASV
jgi:hypothetical protein